MKVEIVGIERSEGISMKTGKPKPFAIGQIHAVVQLDERSSDMSLTKGGMGTTYGVEPDVIRSIEHLPLPFIGELEVVDVMRFGKRESKVLRVVPVGPVSPVVAPKAERVDQSTGEIKKAA